MKNLCLTALILLLPICLLAEKPYDLEKMGWKEIANKKFVLLEASAKGKSIKDVIPKTKKREIR